MVGGIRKGSRLFHSLGVWERTFLDFDRTGGKWFDRGESDCSGIGVTASPGTAGTDRNHTGDHSQHAGREDNNRQTGGSSEGTVAAEGS